MVFCFRALSSFILQNPVLITNQGSSPHRCFFVNANAGGTQIFAPPKKPMELPIKLSFQCAFYSNNSVHTVAVLYPESLELVQLPNGSRQSIIVYL